MTTYLRPDTLDAALSAMEQALPAGEPSRPLSPIAGGTDIYPARAMKEAWLQPSTTDTIDLSRIPELKGIRRDKGSYVIGGATTWSEMVAADLPPVFDALKQAALQVGGRQIQNRGTLAGNIVNASPAADGAPPLISLDAEVELRSMRGERRMPLSTFLRGNRLTDLQPGELLAAIHIPLHRPSARSVFLKLGSRSHLVISIVSVALVVDTGPDGIIADIRITVGACSGSPFPRPRPLWRRRAGTLA